LVFVFFAKSVFFHNLWFYLDGSSISRGQGLFFAAFLALFFSVFLGARFWDVNWKCWVWSAKYSTFRASGVLGVSQKTWFLGQKSEKNTTRKITSFLLGFHEIVTTPTREPRFWGAPKRKKLKKTDIFCAFFYCLLSVFLRTFFVKISSFIITYRFTSIKLSFSHVDHLVS